MILALGDQVGAYRIEALIGSGGMGHVYGAQHLHLQRSVAIKVLPPELAADARSMERLRREARAASNLSHPHICAVYDLVEDPRGVFLVMEFLDGETLADRLEKGPLDPETIANIAIDLANALAHAHGRGIVHGDLKPANVMLTPGGVKILDFGLAKTVQRDGMPSLQLANFPNKTTQLGVDEIRGTPAYMAPEQIENRQIDGRTDLWALGVSLYEMLTGRLPYERGSKHATLAAIITGEPNPFQTLPPNLSPELVEITRRCMALRPEDRYASAVEVASRLRILRQQSSQLRTTATGASNHARRVQVTAGILLLLLIGVGAYFINQRSQPPPPLAFDLQLPPGVMLTQIGLDAALMPDGRGMLFTGTDSSGMHRLWIRYVTTNDAHVLPHSEYAVNPFWSPTGAQLGYFALGSIWVTDTTGRQPQRIAKSSLETRGASWGADDVIIYAPEQHGGLFLVSIATRQIKRLTTPNRSAGEIGHLWPWFLPDGKHFIFFVAADREDARGIYLASVNDPQPRKLISSSGNGVFANNYLLFYRGSDVFAQPFDARSQKLSGKDVPLLQNVAASTSYQAALSVSNTGVLVYSPENTKSHSTLVTLDAHGTRRTSYSAQRHQRDPAISWDGRRIAIEVYEGTHATIEVIDIATGRVHRMSESTRRSMYPVWAPRSYELAFAAEEAGGWGLYIWDPDASAPPRRVYLSTFPILPSDWTPSGEILFSRRGADGYDVAAFNLAANGLAKAVLSQAAHEVNGQVSPSGKLIAYASSSGNGFQIFIEDYPVTGRRCQISIAGGYDPHWGATDRRLFFLDRAGDLIEAAIQPGHACPDQEPIVLFRPGVEAATGVPTQYAVEPKDEMFVFNVPDHNQGQPVISAVVNWPTRAASLLREARSRN